MSTFYFVCFIVSLVILIIYLLNWNKHYNRSFLVAEILSPIVCYGCWKLSTSTTVAEAMVCNDLIYLGGCFLLPIFMLGISTLCAIKLPMWAMMTPLIVSALIYFSIITTEYTGFYYKDIWLEQSNGATILCKTYGFMHTVFYVVLVLYAVLCLALLIYSLRNRRRTPISQITAMLIVAIICLISFFVCQKLLGKMEPTFMYCIAQFGLFVISLRAQYYYVNDFVMSQISAEDGMGCMLFSKKRRLLGCNDVAEKWFPELKETNIDKQITSNNGINGKFDEWFDSIENSGTALKEKMLSGDKYIMLSIREVPFSRSKTGYCVSMRDDTIQQQLMEVLRKNSENLTEQIFIKDENISKLSKTFEHYVDPSIMKEILAGADINLAGKERDVVVLFADIRGFTTLSESLTAEETVHILNSAFELMTKCVMQNQGTLDKFIGDCIMAVWNAPVPQEDSAYLACKTAKEIIAGLPALNDRLNLAAATGISIGIGINSGLATVGNIGFSERMDYTAVGDTVNTASRLKDVAPANITYISESVVEKLDSRVKYTSLGKGIKLKGKNKELEIFTLDYVE